MNSWNSELVVATYNIQSGHRLDRVFDLANTIAAISRLEADVIVLNEVDCVTERTERHDFVAEITDRLGLHGIFGPAFALEGGFYGNAVLSRFPLRKVANLPIPDNGVETRAALIVEVLAEPQPFYCVATHLPFEPHLSSARLAAWPEIQAALQKYSALPAILCGDFNVDIDAPEISALRAAGFAVFNDLHSQLKSHPANAPKILLDYITAFPARQFRLIDYEIVDEPAASDHRPARARIQISGTGM